jgi:tetratricopeptide (TPR) repeat protein
MKRLHAELADIRLALEWSRDHDVEIGLRLVGSLPLFWMEHNLLAEGDRWCAELLTLGEDASAAARAKALNCAAVFAGIRGNHADAEPLHENALALCRELGDLGGIAWALTGLATPLAETGRSEQAREYLEEALPIHREVGDELGVKCTVQQLGTVLSELGDVGHGRALLHESIEIAHGQGDRFGEIVSRHSLGDL